jgi:hypothetical protein
LTQPGHRSLHGLVVILAGLAKYHAKCGAGFFGLVC